MTATENSLTTPAIVLEPPAGSRRRPRKSKHRPAWEEPPTVGGAIAKFAALALVVLAVLGPLYTIVLTSLSPQSVISEAGGIVLVPGEITFAAYQQLLDGGVVFRSVVVSIGVTAVGTLISTVVSVLAAFGLSRTDSFLHRPILFVFLITMFFGAGLIPTYLWVSQLGLIDSYWALILPGAISAFNVLILRNFFMGIDASITDAARIDGAGDWRVLGSIVLPMSRAVVAVVALFYGVGYWNAFFNAMLYLRDSAKWPLQMVLRAYVLRGQPPQGTTGTVIELGAGGAVPSLAAKMAVMVLALVPILIVYPFVQRHFTKGVIFGAIKG